MCDHGMLKEIFGCSSLVQALYALQRTLDSGIDRWHETGPRRGLRALQGLPLQGAARAVHNIQNCSERSALSKGGPSSGHHEGGPDRSPSSCTGSAAAGSEGLPQEYRAHNTKLIAKATRRGCRLPRRSPISGEGKIFVNGRFPDSYDSNPEPWTSPHELWLQECPESRDARSELLQAFGERRICGTGMDAEQSKVQLLRIPE